MVLQEHMFLRSGRCCLFRCVLLSCAKFSHLFEKPDSSLKLSREALGYLH